MALIANRRSVMTLFSDPQSLHSHRVRMVLAEKGIPGQAEIYGVANLNADPDNERAEYAIVLQGDMTGMGLDGDPSTVATWSGGHWVGYEDSLGNDGS